MVETKSINCIKSKKLKDKLKINKKESRNFIPADFVIFKCHFDLILLQFNFVTHALNGFMFISTFKFPFTTKIKYFKFSFETNLTDLRPCLCDISKRPNFGPKDFEKIRSHKIWR